MSELPVHVATDEIATHPRRTGQRWFDVIIAVCAIFISVLSLFVAVEHGRTERDLVAASSWPFLRSEITNDYNGDHGIAIGVSNGGVGPAKIRSYELMLDGRPIGSPAELLARCCGLARDAASVRRMLPRGAARMSMIDNTVLRPGETNPVLIVSRDAIDPAFFSKLNAALPRLSFKACYCSALDQCWTTNLETIATIPVKECQAPAHPYAYNLWPAK